MHSLLTRHATTQGPRWALDGRYLPQDFTLSRWLAGSSTGARDALAALPPGEAADAPLLAPVEDHQEVWASGVTYLSSRMAREAESQTADVYQRVYGADRPELFFKANGWRVVGHGAPIRVRADSQWDVPEPELVLVIGADGGIVGYTTGNDVSSRSIEGENPLYLPQAKVYDRSCALGPVIALAGDIDPLDLAVTCVIERAGEPVFTGETHTRQIHRSLEKLVAYLGRCNTFPAGAWVMTGTGVVPPDTFTLQQGDVIHITFEGLGTLTNPVVELSAH